MKESSSCVEALSGAYALARGLTWAKVSNIWTMAPRRLLTIRRIIILAPGIVLFGTVKPRLQSYTLRILVAWQNLYPNPNPNS